MRTRKAKGTILKPTFLSKRSLSIVDIRPPSTLIINSINILEVIERWRSLQSFKALRKIAGIV